MGRIFLSKEKNEVSEYLLDNLIHNIENIPKKIPNPTYKPSSIDCIRKMFFIMNEVEPVSQTFDYQMIGIQESGTDRHIRIQKAIKNIPAVADIEYITVADYVKENKLDYLKVNSFNEYETHLFDNRYKLSFMCDGLLKIKGKYYILEIKTEASNKFFSHNEPYQTHIEQVSCYALSLGIDEVLFIYENRDLLTKNCFYFKVSRSDKNLIIKRIENCDKYIKSGKIPPKPIEAQNASFCNYCNYKSICSGGK